MTQFNRIVIFLIDRGCSSEAFFLKQIPIPSQRLSKTQQNPSSKRVASINIDGKLKSEYNVVFTALLVKLRKTIMFSPKKSCQLTCPMYQHIFSSKDNNVPVYRYHPPDPLSRLQQKAKADRWLNCWILRHNLERKYVNNSYSSI